MGETRGPVGEYNIVQTKLARETARGPLQAAPVRAGGGVCTGGPLPFGDPSATFQFSFGGRHRWSAGKQRRHKNNNNEKKKNTKKKTALGAPSVRYRGGGDTGER